MATASLFLTLLVSSFLMRTTESAPECSLHSDCAPNQYCTRGAQSPVSSFTRCRHCESCESPALPVDEPLSRPCPTKCSCSAHDDCGPTEYCSRFNDNLNVCLSCQSCARRRSSSTGRDYPFDGSRYCPDKCLCTSAASSECPDGRYCARQHPKSLTPRDKGMCLDCNSPTGCVDRLILMNDDTDVVLPTCQELCPAAFECDKHEDCSLAQFVPNATSTTNTTAHPWCSQNHRCHECVQDSRVSDKLASCWTPLRLPIDSPYAVADPDSYYDKWRDFPELSIDFSCPVNCCDWGMPAPVSQPIRSTRPLTLGLCNPEAVVTAYWVNGHHPEKSIPEFVQQGQACNVARYEFATGYPKTVSIVECPGYSVDCRLVNRTLALLSTAADNNNNNTQFLDEPLVTTVDRTRIRCALDDVTKGIVAPVFAAIALFVLVFILMAGTYWWCVHGQHNPCSKTQNSELDELPKLQSRAETDPLKLEHKAWNAENVDGGDKARSSLLQSDSEEPAAVGEEETSPTAGL